MVVVQRAVDLDEVYEQRRCRKQTRPWCHAHSEAGATADEGPAERCHCWGRKHRQRESVEGGEREGERSQLEQLQVAGEREVCEAGEEQSSPYARAKQPSGVAGAERCSQSERLCRAAAAWRSFMGEPVGRACREARGERRNDGVRQGGAGRGGFLQRTN